MLRRGPFLTIDQLEPGDILLSKATRLYGWLIAGLDRSLYTHAAIWTGEGVVEAVPYCVVHWSLRESANARRRQFVDVFRWKEANRTVLGNVVACARGHEGEPYAMTDVLHMLHGIASSAEPLNVLRPKLPRLMEELREYERLGPRRGVTCSELVAKAFIEAGRPLHVELPTTEGTRSAVVAATQADPELAALITLCARVVRLEQELNKGDAYRSADAAVAGRDLYLITPKDLSRSPSLERIGRLRRSEEVLRHVTTTIPKPKPAAGPERSAMSPTRTPTVPLPGVRPTGRQRLLYIAAAPGHRAPIDSDGELAAIGASLQQSTYGKQIKKRWPALRASAQDIALAVEDEQPTLIHFAGHGSDLGLAAQNRTLGLEDLLAILSEHTARLQLAVLNACNTAELARGLSAHVRVVIGLRGPIREVEAKTFAAALYLMLGTGRTIRAAFEFASRELTDPACAVLETSDEAHAQVAIVGELTETSAADPVAAVTFRSPPLGSRKRRWWLTMLAVAIMTALASAFAWRERLSGDRSVASTDRGATPPVGASASLDISAAQEHKALAGSQGYGAAPTATEPDRPRRTEAAQAPALQSTAPKPRAPVPSTSQPTKGVSLFELSTGKRTSLGASLELKPLRPIYVYAFTVAPSGAASVLHASLATSRKVLSLPAVMSAAEPNRTLVVLASERELADVSPKDSALVRMVQQDGRVRYPGSFARMATAGAGMAGISVVAKTHDNGVARAAIALGAPPQTTGRAQAVAKDQAGAPRTTWVRSHAKDLSAAP